MPSELNGQDVTGGIYGGQTGQDNPLTSAVRDLISLATTQQRARVN